MRFFNTAGPCDPRFHYMLPAAERLPEARLLIDEGQYFVVHAPRQTGKTTTLEVLAKELTAEGHYAALHFSCESAEPAQDNYESAQRDVLWAIARAADIHNLPVELRPPKPWPDASGGSLLSEGLTRWAQQCPRPLVLFFDEIDALRGESLRSVLRQLRDGFRSRPDAFPASVVLCGLRDVRDYRAAAGSKNPSHLGTASPFNIKVTSLRLGDFSEAEVAALYAQHTDETGQLFTDDAVRLAFDYTQGQPWLVNALAREITRVMGIARSTPITPEHVDEAKERLIVARATHLDSLVARLSEPRVQRVIEPLIAGNAVETDLTFNDDISYLRDLGLLAPTKPTRIANPIYKEVILRVLAARIEEQIFDDPRSFVLSDGRLDFDKLLTEFTEFWKQHGEILTRDGYYHEAAPQLTMLGYLHRIVNGGGYIDREYGIGHGRIDLLIRWPYADKNGKRIEQREAIELKVWRHNGDTDPLNEGLTQLDRYLQSLSLDRGTLVIFDRRGDAKPLAERVEFHEAQTPTGRPVTLLRV